VSGNTLNIDETDRLIYIEGMKPATAQRRSAGPYRSERSQNAILDAAIQVADSDGYAAASIEKIARRAGAGKQTIYRWYGSKAALYVDAYIKLVSALPPEDVTGNAEADLTSLLRDLFRIYFDTAAGVILAGLVGASAEDPETADQIRAGLMVGRQSVLRDPLEQAISAGNLPSDFSVDAAVEVTVALIWYRLLADPQKLDAAYAASIVRRAIASGKIGQ
jgi:AcrR family transcriptional regulator